MLSANEISEGLLADQVQRILQSDEFRHSEMLQRLLSYLAEKSASGTCGQLKEYTIAIEGLGKASSYDPQRNSAVRILVGRLRSKLIEYYRASGQNDKILIELAKGSFCLKVTELSPEPLEEEPTPVAPQVAAAALPAPVIPQPTRVQRSFLVGLLLGMALFAGGAFLARTTIRYPSDSALAAGWPPQLETIWAPFVDSSRPLLVAIEDPLFVELRSNPGVYYRDRSLNEWSNLRDSPTIKMIGTSLSNPDIQPSRYYTAFGEVEASLTLGRLLGPHVQAFALSRASQLTWQQLADNNVLFVGVQNLFFDQIHALPIEPQLIPRLDGVSNPHPAPGESSFYADQYETAPSEQGVIYALATRLPGPAGTNVVASFTSNRSAGYVAAVQWFTDPKSAKVLIEKLKEANGGKMPRYYQVLFRVKFNDDVPTETAYVLGRALHQ